MDDRDTGDARDPEGICPACHTPVFAGNNFCEACGQRITPAPPEAGTVPAGNTPAANVPAGNVSAAGGPADDGPGTPSRHLAGDGLAESPGAGPCTGCGGTAIDADGYCERCGLRSPGGRDHLESELTGADGGVAAAGVSDRGLRHSKNEDAMALAIAQGGVAAVVCDGVSSSPRPEDASRVAADTGVAVLLKELESGADPETATRKAVLQAAQAVAALAPSEYDAPACTYVSALTGAGTVTVGWVGDSRAYWLPVTMGQVAGLASAGTGSPDPHSTDLHSTDPHSIDPHSIDLHSTDPEGIRLDSAGTGPAGTGRRLTQDDSWAEQMVALGALSEIEAQTHRNAHVLVGWLGADADAVQAHVRGFRPEGPGVVIVCSDGLWNYLPEAATIGGALAEALPGPPAGVSAAAADPLAAARSLVDVALDSGGRDNITVVVIPILPATSAAPKPPAPPSTEPAE